MKVFKFNPTTGKRGDLISEVARFCAYSNMEGASCVLPKNTNDTTWNVASKVEDRQGNEVKFTEPVCFCLGQMTCGTDTSWEWIAYIPK
jgi:hypothetical protein